MPVANPKPGGMREAIKSGAPQALAVLRFAWEWLKNGWSWSFLSSLAAIAYSVGPLRLRCENVIFASKIECFFLLNFDVVFSCVLASKWRSKWRKIDKKCAQKSFAFFERFFYGFWVEKTCLRSCKTMVFLKVFKVFHKIAFLDFDNHFDEKKLQK